MSDHGRFIWYELMTPDLSGAKSFYGPLLGWTFDEMANDGMPYVIAGPGAGVAGLMGMTPDMLSAGMAPHWLGYVAVDDVDAATEKAAGLGGAASVPPTDIPGIGRFAVITDPTGAAIAMMTPAPMDEPPPEPLAGAPGTAGWRELYAGDLEAAWPFYGELFGWTQDSDMDMGQMGAYRLFSTPDGPTGGLMTKPEQVPVPCWTYYFRVGDIDSAAAALSAAGGQLIMGPMEVPGGDWVLQATDPQGAVFALMGSRAA